MTQLDIAVMDASAALFGWTLAAKAIGSLWPLLLAERPRMLERFRMLGNVNETFRAAMRRVWGVS